MWTAYRHQMSTHGSLLAGTGGRNRDLAIMDDVLVDSSREEDHEHRVDQRLHWKSGIVVPVPIL